MRIRYILPAVPPLVLLAVFGIYQTAAYIKERTSGASQWVGSILLALVLIILIGQNGRYLMEQFDYVKPWQYINGHISRDDYIIRYRPGYSVKKWANENLPPTAKILCLYLGRRP